MRLALGGVGTTPWRARRAEAAADRRARRRTSRSPHAAAAELARAVVREHNAFKVELAQRAIVRGLTRPADGRPAMSPRSASPSTGSTAPSKVTGAAPLLRRDRAAADLAYAAIVGATIAERPGRRDRRPTRREAAGGVLAILTHENLPKIAAQPHLLPVAGRRGRARGELLPDAGRRRALRGPAGRARRRRAPRAGAARGVAGRRHGTSDALGRRRSTRAATSAYEAETAVRRADAGAQRARRRRRGARARPTCASTSTYRFAANHHNPIEALGDHGGVGRRPAHPLRLDAWASARRQLTVAQLLGMPLSDVRVVTHFVGGGFGCKAMVWPHVTLAAMAARHVGRPVRLALTRPQMFTSERPPRGAGAADHARRDRDGRLTAIRHQKLSVTSPFDDWAEPATGVVVAALRLPELPRACTG